MSDIFPSPFRRAYVQEYGPGEMEPEHAAAQAVLEGRGLQCVRFNLKALHRNRIPVDRTSLYIGDHDVIASVLKRLGLVTERETYPQGLLPFLHRRIWESTPARLRQGFGTGDYLPIFVKPRYRSKYFTGFVAQSDNDLYLLETLAKRTPLYCAEVVRWQAEFRVFVQQDRVVGVRNYAGNPELLPDPETVADMLLALREAGEATAGYGIDVGILDNGKTALVEWNDGFALGAYGLNDAAYTGLLVARWAEIVAE
ncbi:MAG: ATP-grasp domain-containing protein [Bacteroidota bacterium]